MLEKVLASLLLPVALLNCILINLNAFCLFKFCLFRLLGSSFPGRSSIPLVAQVISKKKKKKKSLFVLSHHYMLSSSCSQKQTYLNFCLPLAFRLHVEVLLRWWVTSVASLCFHGKSGECLTKPKTLIAFFSFYPPNDWVEIYKHCNWIKVKTAI